MIFFRTHQLGAPMKSLLVAFLYLTSLQIILCQTQDQSVSNLLAFSPGVQIITLKDQTFSPTVFSGVIPNISLGYEQNRANEKLWRTTLSASIVQVTMYP